MCSIDNDHTIWYNYDAKGVVGIKVDKTEYLFHRNALGDVTRIYKKQTDGGYELEARYEYDAWGNPHVYDADGVENTDKNFIGNINPIRYRGYYYDVDTGLYYLNARYYDPRLCRFISADETKYLDPNTVNGLNLYAYCGNNPVMFVDPSGNAMQSVFNYFEWIFTGMANLCRHLAKRGNVIGHVPKIGGKGRKYAIRMSKNIGKETASIGDMFGNIANIVAVTALF